MASKRAKKHDKTTAVLCSGCGVEMNKHAAKVVEPRNAEDAAQMNPNLGGMISDVFSCPECGGMKSLQHP